MGWGGENEGAKIGCKGKYAANWFAVTLSETILVHTNNVACAEGYLSRYILFAL